MFLGEKLNTDLSEQESIIKILNGEYGIKKITKLKVLEGES